MTTPTDRRTVTMPELVEALSQPDPWDIDDITDLLVQLWAGSTAQHAEDGYTQQVRIISAILGRDVDPEPVVNGAEAARAAFREEDGAHIDLRTAAIAIRGLR